MDAVRVAVALGQRRKHDHADRAVGVVEAFVPHDEDRAVVAVSLGIENLRQLARQPAVALRDLAVGRRTGVMHVVAEVRNDPVVARHRVALQIPHQLRVRANVGDAVRRVRSSGW